MRLALDTNVLVYAEGVGDARRCSVAIDLVEHLAGIEADAILPAQVLGELFRVLTGKAGRPATAARESVLAWADAFETADSPWTAFQAAFDLAADHGLSLWDALILSVAAEQGCRLLLSEEDVSSGTRLREYRLSDGRYAEQIDAEGSYAEVSANPEVITAYLGSEAGLG